MIEIIITGGNQNEIQDAIDIFDSNHNGYGTIKIEGDINIEDDITIPSKIVLKFLNGNKL